MYTDRRIEPDKSSVRGQAAPLICGRYDMKMKEIRVIRACFVATGILAALVFVWALFFVPYRHLFQADQVFVAVPEIGEQQLGGRVRDALAAGKANRVVFVAGLGTMLALIAAVGLKLTSPHIFQKPRRTTT